MFVCICVRMYVYTYIQGESKVAPNICFRIVNLLFDVCIKVCKKVEINERHVFNLFILNYSISSGNKEL